MISWIREQKNIVRAGALVLFLLALLGPWSYDSIFVPAEYACTKPIVRLEGDLCGIPISGFQFLSWGIGGFFSMLVQAGRGTFTGRGRELIIGLSLLLAMPFFSTLVLLWKNNSPWLQVLNRIAWALAGGLLGILFAFQLRNQGLRLWGLWLYAGLAITVFMYELRIRSLPANGS